MVDDPPEDAPEPFDLWEEHIEAVEAFLEICDQWLYPPMGGLPLGLNALAVFEWLKCTGRRSKIKELWPKMQLIASGALDELGKLEK